MKHQLLLTLGLLMTSLSFGQTYFSKQEVREELNTLKKTLIDAHYNAFAYTTPEAFEAGYQDVYNKITQDSLSLLETTNLLHYDPGVLFHVWHPPHPRVHASFVAPQKTQALNIAQCNQERVFPQLHAGCKLTVEPGLHTGESARGARKRR